ncbi:pyridoxal phosphate-dependent transferase [Lentinula edodes]|uniref:Classes i and n=2 Tax=Lentinula TaxID=5352 RepID=A0A1Q3ELI4_LENED|nr:pyridoxal phosphate-dependent transferase [Lentinula edodes]KAJ4464365.1 pyridoxal phosphate-dependent transferase [Lentinula lateritia]GAW08036.1 classes i and [Lentinula edodes]
MPFGFSKSGNNTPADGGSPFSSRPGTPKFKDVVLDVMRNMKHEKDSEAHQIFRQSAGHAPKGVRLLPETVNPEEETVPGIQHPGSTGVIYCSERAIANGFSYTAQHEWANLGQGAPEVGPIPNAPERPKTIQMPEDSLEYAPTTGVKALREAVANLYNVTYRQNKASQYTYENVCIVPGGRAGLSRVAAVIGDVYTSYQIPDYTAYDQVLSAFKRLVPVPTALDPSNKYKLDIQQTKKDIATQGLAVILASNPRNPTGQVIKGNDLKELVALGREGSTVILDEFYSWYIYPENDKDLGKSISSAEYVEDVNQDAVIIVDGLTKNWRLPGWRVCWVIGPKNLVTALSQSGSFLDGGANHPLQLAAIPLLDPTHARNERVALQKHFKMKRDHVLARLKDLHLDVDVPPHATFYIWLNLEKLPAPLNNGLTFFEELLKEQTIVIPGIFFDINPSHRRNLFNSPCHHFVRLSFGPPVEDLDKGIDAIARVLKKAKKEGMRAFGHSYKKSIDEPINLASKTVDQV